MDKETATRLFETLASGVRLDVFRLLVRHGDEGMVAGEISTTLKVAPANLSFHLKAMTHAGLVTAEQEGRYQRYRANFFLIQGVINYLTEECCAGRPGLCLDLDMTAGKP
jgi:ArsR family transcriptional regulator, arsenate/arsenite/antimonite-responsive transcriptional repressor